MKTLKTIIAAFAIAFGAIAANAQSMSYEAMRNNARFLTDRMAYELGIRSMSVIDDIYRINLDYIYGVNEYLDEIALGYHYDDYMDICARRDYALRHLLGDIVWNRLLGFAYFHRPIIFSNYRWHFGIYDHDHYGIHHYFYREPRHFHRDYRPGHFFGGMRPAGGHIARPVPQPHREGAAPHRDNAMPNRPHDNNVVRHQGTGNTRPDATANRQQRGSDTRPDNAGRQQAGNNSMRHDNAGRTQGGNVGRTPTTGRSENNMRSSSRSNSSSRPTAAPSRSGASRTGTTSAGHSTGGASRGGRR